MPPATELERDRLDSENHSREIPLTADGKPDVEQLMRDIRAEVLESAGEATGRLPRYNPPQDTGLSAATSPVLYSDELNYLNANWNNWAVPEQITSHRKFGGGLIAKLKTKFRDFLWSALFQGYFERERQYQMQLVTLLNKMARYIDARDAEVFWQLVEKVDADVKSSVERSDQLAYELSQQIKKEK